METSARPTRVTFHVTVSEDSDGSYWAKVDELPGCFASGFDLEEVKASTFDAIQLWLPDGIELGEPTWRVVEPESVVEKAPAAASRKRRRSPNRRLLVCA